MTQKQPRISAVQGRGTSRRDAGWGPFCPSGSMTCPGEGAACAVGISGGEGRGEFVSWKGKRIYLAWCNLLQKGGFSSKGKGNETEKCLPLSKRDGEPCVIVLSAGASRSVFASNVASRQRPEGAVLQRDVLRAAAGDGDRGG